MTEGIVLRGVTKTFGDAVAVNNIDLVMEREKLTVILGPSGCGKTTILRMIAGLENPTAGTIEIAGRPVFGPNRVVPTEDRNIGIVFQSYALWPHMTVRDNIAFPLRMRGVARAEQTRRLAEMAKLVQLEQYLGRHPQQLSGGQQQRVALARALIANPTTLLLDEPLANLDARLRDSMRNEIKRLQRETRTTAAHVTHDQGEAMALADHVVVMNHGVIIGQGSPRDLYQAPSSLFVAQFLGELNQLAAEIEARRAGTSLVRVGGQLVQVEGSQALPEDLGTKVILAFRPGDTTIRARSPSGELPSGSHLILAATVREATFQGLFQQIVLEAAGGRMIVAYHKPQELLDVGQPVTISVSGEHLLLFRASEEQQKRNAA